MFEVEIIVQGQIAEQWAEWFENLTISYPGMDQSVLSGPVVDQAALNGVLSRLWDLGLPLVSVRTDRSSISRPSIFINARAIIERDAPEGREIVLQVRNKPGEGGKWLELPGGRVEPFESMVGALQREVREETGLEITAMTGLEDRVTTGSRDADVECLAPFSAYQTLRGPVDSLGLYFRCRARGDLLPAGDETEAARWTPVRQVSEWLMEDLLLVGNASREQRFSWVDRAGLLFYLKDLERSFPCL